MATPPLLEPFLAVTSIFRSLYGPNKHRKVVHSTEPNAEPLLTTDVAAILSALHSEHAALSMLQSAVEMQRFRFGTGSTTLVNWCDVLLEAAMDLHRLGFPVEEIIRGLHSAQDVCAHTCELMRVAVADFTGWQSALDDTQRLHVLAQHIQSDDGQREALVSSDAPLESSLTPSMKTALEIALTQMVERTQRAPCMNESLVFRVVAGRSVETTASLYDGLLLPISNESHEHSVLKRLSIAVEREGAALIRGDLDIQDEDDMDDIRLLLHGVGVVFVHGTATERAIDCLWSLRPDPVLCIPVDNAQDLNRLVNLCENAIIVDSIYEILPICVSRSKLHLCAVHVSQRHSQRLHDIDGIVENNVDIFFHVKAAPRIQTACPTLSVMVSGPTNSLAMEYAERVKSSLHRLRNVLQHGHVLPGGGAVPCGCSVMLEQYVSQRDSSSSLAPKNVDNLIYQRLVEAFRHLGVRLLENQGIISDFLTNLSLVGALESEFRDGIAQLDSATQYFAVAPLLTSQRLTLLKQQTRQRVDDYEAIDHAIHQAFHTVTRALQVDQYMVNTSHNSTDEFP